MESMISPWPILRPATLEEGRTTSPCDLLYGNTRCWHLQDHCITVLWVEPVKDKPRLWRFSGKR